MPTGPFHRIVFARSITSRKVATLLGPISKIFPSGGTWLRAKVNVRVPAFASPATTQSTGSTSFFPERSARFQSHGSEERVRHSPADQDVIDARQQTFNHVDLSGNLGTAENRD